VEEAYAAIPHHRTVFDRSSSKLSPAQVGSLTQLFAGSDQATVLRVQAMRDLRAGRLQDVRKAMDSYRALLASLGSAQPTADVKPAQTLIVEAIQDHQRFFEGKLRQTTDPTRIDLGFTPEVHQASQKLRRAYDVLMRAFPNEPGINKAAFYDYLCALDFL
jgi:hypothetical protein